MSAQFIVPTPGESNTLSGNVDILNGGEIAVGEENSGEDPAFLAHTGWFWELAEGHDVEVGASIWSGRFDESGSLDSDLYGLDLLYTWKPFISGESRSFLVGGEVFYAEIEREGLTDTTPFGGYVWGQVQLNRNLYVNGRFDYTEDLFDTSLETRTASTAVSYYTTEFLRFRLGYERTFSDIPELDHLDTVFFEINFVFGSHPAEPYWVNR